MGYLFLFILFSFAIFIIKLQIFANKISKEHNYLFVRQKAHEEYIITHIARINELGEKIKKIVEGMQDIKIQVQDAELLSDTVASYAALISSTRASILDARKTVDDIQKKIEEEKEHEKRKVCIYANQRKQKAEKRKRKTSALRRFDYKRLAKAIATCLLSR